MKIAIYARTSTGDGRQNMDLQLVPLREFAAYMPGWRVVKEYCDTDSGGRPADKLPALTNLLNDAAQKKFNAVLVWKLDRFSRRGIAETFELLKRLKQCGIDFYSATEEHFRTSGHMGELMLALFAWMAEQERKIMSERVRAGMARAKQEGAKFGRKYKILDLEKVKQMRARKVPFSAIAQELGVSVPTLYRRLGQAAKAAQPETIEPGDTDALLHSDFRAAG